MKLGAGVAVVALAAMTAACGRYGNFTLPPLHGGSEHLRIWLEERYTPEIERGAWHDLLNPSAVGNTHIYYSGWDGRTWHTGHARRDGDHWRDLGTVLSPDPRTWEGSYIAANGSALDGNGAVWYWYVAGPRDRPRIGLARDWHKEPQPVLQPGPYMSWDEYGVADPYVIRIGKTFYMYYLGEDRAARQRIGVARSEDGLHWQKLTANPVLEIGAPGAIDENGLGEPAVWQQRGYYWMLYTGRGAGEVRRLGLARSTDGLHWSKMQDVFEGAREWDSKVMCDPSVEPLDDSQTLVWFGGGNVARPDENLNGQIGFGTLHMVAQ
jgi:Glycosyl hydrolases family 32 N-terminal domain